MKRICWKQNEAVVIANGFPKVQNKQIDQRNPRNCIESKPLDMVKSNDEWIT